MRPSPLIISLLLAGLYTAPLGAASQSQRGDTSERIIEDEDADERPELSRRERRALERAKASRRQALPEPPREQDAPPAPVLAATPAPAEDIVRETRFVYLKPSEKPQSDKHERGLKLGGPRFGVTYVDGPTSKKLKDTVKDSSGQLADVKPWLALFGWHTEYRFFRTEGGTTALMEFIPLVGGLNQGLVLPAASLLFGLRTKEGWEFGAGPTASLDGASYVVAAGYNFDLGGLNIPLNAAVGFGMERSSYTIATGFNL